MFVLLQILALALLLLIVQEALRRSNRWLIWAIFLLLPSLLTPYWLTVNELGFFSWFKYYTVFFCAIYGAALRFTCLGESPWARRVIPMLLAVNVLEATAVDLYASGPAHLMNAAAGILLVAMQPYGESAVRIDTNSRHRDLLYKIDRRWVIGYTLWNWTFVYLNYPALTGHHTAVLATGLVVAMLAPHRWSQTRASTLGAHLLLTATCYKNIVAWLDTSSWVNEPLALLAASASFTLMLLYLLPTEHALYPKIPFTGLPPSTIAIGRPSASGNIKS